MRHAIETAPRDGKAVILEHDPTGTYDVAHWSAQVGQWITENGEPSKITPTHWRPMPGDKYPEHDETHTSSQPWPSSPRAPRLITACWITLIAAVLTRLYFGFGQETPLLSEDPRTTYSLALRQQDVPGQAEVVAGTKAVWVKEDPGAHGTPRAIEGPDVQLQTAAANRAESLEQEWRKTVALAQETAAARQVSTTSTAESRQALDVERARSDALKSELATARRENEVQAQQLRVARDEAADSARSQEQKAEALTEAAAARQELTTLAATLREALDEERTRSVALKSELATAQRENEMQAAQLRKASEEAEQLKQAAVAEAAESLERERQKTAAIAREAAAARQELIASMAKHRQTLDEERARRAGLWSELAAAQREIKTQAAQLRKAGEEIGQLKQAAAADSAQSLEQERQKTVALAQEAAAARQDLTASAAKHRQALDEERTRNAALTDELATAKRENEMQTAQLRKASEEMGQLKQAAAADNARSVKQKQQKTAALVQEAEAARQELTASAAKHRQALDEERARSAALTGELVMAKRENEMQTAQLRKAGEEMGQLKQATERAMTDLRQSLQQERDRTEAMAREIESARRTTAVRASPEPAPNSSLSRAAHVIEVAPTEQPPVVDAQGSPEATRLIARARTLLGQGNIGAARIVLERAAETGSARASFSLAETYDPAILSTWGTYGTRGDAMKAREFYAKAHAGGIQDAKDRLERLDQ
ncbi:MULTISPECIES: hypothetical protein [unclassified Bradyrhizobium]|uniref:hypothetical protein n=1 Tax=unclassified Bradyrhizobium TaxID=2631580 RepID=UPI002FF3699C